MRKITDSAIYNQIAKNQKVMTVLSGQQINRDKVSSTEIEEPLSVINKKLKFATTSLAMKYLVEGKIVLIYNEEYRLPKYMNTVGRLYQNKPVATVDLSRFAKKPVGSKELDIFPKTLFNLIHNGLTLIATMENWNRITTNINFLKSATASYVKLVTKVFDKLFAITINPVKTDTISFILAKFFLTNMCGKSFSDTVDNIAFSACYGGTPLNVIKIEADKIAESEYKDIFTLFKSMDFIKGIETLNVRTFVENWVRMYGDAALLSLDYLPSFLNLIFGSIITGNISKDFLVEATASKYNQIAFAEFAKLIR